MENIKEYYTNQFPTDDLGFKLNDEATFEGLFKTLDTYGEMYDYIGVVDSLIRERLFDRLAEIMSVPYHEVYNQWAMAKA
jgi:hypothetical protein